LIYDILVVIDIGTSIFTAGFQTRNKTETTGVVIATTSPNIMHPAKKLAAIATLIFLCYIDNH
jgi:hypothetical protein